MGKNTLNAIESSRWKYPDLRHLQFTNVFLRVTKNFRFNQAYL